MAAPRSSAPLLRDAHAAPAGGDDRAEANARLTASTAVVLLVLLAVEGVTVLRIHSLLSLHALVGGLLIPPVLLKMASTFYRFARYYLGSPTYRRKGPPPVILRLLGPVVVVTTVTVFASGTALVLVGASLRQPLLFVHKASFVLWFLAMAVHVLGHLLETGRLAPRDWASRSRAQVRGAGLRQWAVATSVVVGLPVGLWLMSQAGSWPAHISN